jgi:hypothetical protein
MLIGRVFHNPIGISTLTVKIRSYTITPLYSSFSGSGGWGGMRSDVDQSNEEKNFVEFRRKVRSAEVLSAAMEHLLLSLQFTGRVTVVVQNGRVLKSGYEEGYFRRREN